ncbi:hypothetical protein BCU68_03730 [Vibrio sp. 10N.286.49.B3]|uniref:sensor histidine kinase n=1 Tax=Vibrio sp. 10N.286.49.B3 TaxID=1880855 RepID=UPI000CB90F83|nr:ATP-binding protein [Vibrio sp. 10N.286.49.B3]PMH43111.1 hypothetical protein BCU68_03730 [Vibrio sp. 10N.286.49.B3]
MKHRTIEIKPFILYAFSLASILTLCSYYFFVYYYESNLTTQLESSTHYTEQQIHAEMAKFQQIPNLLSHDPRVTAFFGHPSSLQNLNDLTKKWAAQTLADAIYIHNGDGQVIAASNFDSHYSFVGENFDFRPYFYRAIQGENTQFFALGLKSNQRGYYFSSPIYAQDQIVGVITVKVNLALIEQHLNNQEFKWIAIDSNGIVFLASDRTWLYQVLMPLSMQQKRQLDYTQQYGSQVILANTGTEQHQPSNIYSQTPFESDALLKQKETYFYVNPVNEQSFQVISLYNRANITQQSLQQTLLILVIYSLMTSIIWFWVQTYNAKKYLTQLNLDLETKVHRRTLHLYKSNQQLQQTLFQYQKSQLLLKNTQNELTQAAKLALLGELSASINHEINQPLAALKVYTINCSRLLENQNYDIVAGNLKKMHDLNETISHIIARLKVFTRKTSTEKTDQASLHQAIHNSLAILSATIIRKGITLKIPPLPHDITIKINAIQLEQILINLIHNAIQALEKTSNPKLGINWQISGNCCQVSIWDNGAGIKESDTSTLFDPFYTTKPEGLGLGLTICKRMLENYGGTINAFNRQPSGCTFKFELTLSSN